jgi:hypothetical protein
MRTVELRQITAPDAMDESRDKSRPPALQCAALPPIWSSPPIDLQWYLKGSFPMRRGGAFWPDYASFGEA